MTTFQRIISVYILAALLVIGLARVQAAPQAATPNMQPLFLDNGTQTTSTLPGPADALFTSLAANAQTSIDIALYDVDRASVRDALLAAKARGVAVRVVGDNEIAADPIDGNALAQLGAAGIPIVTDAPKSSLMHNKFAVFDSRTTWTGSTNFSNTAFTRNAENSLVITDTQVASIYRAEFAEMFGGKFSTAKTDNTTHAAIVDSSLIEVAFAPSDGVEARIVSSITTAQSSIQVAMFTFTNATIGQALIAAKGRGVAVEVLLDSLADSSQYSQRDVLCAAGVTVRAEAWGGKLHDKYAVVDAGTDSDPLVLTGSTNWTGNAVQANDENLVIVHNRAVADAYAVDAARLRDSLGAGTFACNLPQAPASTSTPSQTRSATPSQTPSQTPSVTRSVTVTSTPTRTPFGVLRVYLPLLWTGRPNDELTPTIIPSRPTPVPGSNITPTSLTSPTSPATATAISTPTNTSTPPPTATATATTAPASGTGAVISFIAYDPPGDDVAGEYVWIANMTDAPVNLTSWTLRDLANNRYTFPAYTLPALTVVQVWTKAGTNNGLDLYWGRNQAVWNNTGDTAILSNAAGVEVSQYTYP